MSTKRPHDDDELDQPSSKAFLVQKWLNGVEVVAERDEDASNADDSEGTIVLSSVSDLFPWLHTKVLLGKNSYSNSKQPKMFRTKTLAKLFYTATSARRRMTLSTAATVTAPSKRKRYTLRGTIILRMAGSLCSLMRWI